MISSLRCMTTRAKVFKFDSRFQKHLHNGRTCSHLLLNHTCHLLAPRKFLYKSRLSSILSFTFCPADKVCLTALVNYNTKYLINMSDDNRDEGDNEQQEKEHLPFQVGYDKRGQAKCKVCKIKFNKGMC